MLRDEISSQPKLPSRFSFGPDYRPDEVQSDFRLEAQLESQGLPPPPLFFSPFSLLYLDLRVTILGLDWKCI